MLGGGIRRIELEATLASLSCALGTVTLVWHDWFEVTGWRPDDHGGAVEWMIAAAFLLVALLLGIHVRTRRR